VHQKPASDGWMFVTKRGRGRAKAMPSYNYTGKLRPYPVSPTSEVRVAVSSGTTPCAFVADSRCMYGCI
jgi:hypothetical protein